MLRFLFYSYVYLLKRWPFVFILLRNIGLTFSFLNYIQLFGITDIPEIFIDIAHNAIIFISIFSKIKFFFDFNIYQPVFLVHGNGKKPGEGGHKNNGSTYRPPYQYNNGKFNFHFNIGGSTLAWAGITLCTTTGVYFMGKELLKFAQDLGEIQGQKILLKEEVNRLSIENIQQKETIRYAATKHLEDTTTIIQQQQRIDYLERARHEVLPQSKECSGVLDDGRPFTVKLEKNDNGFADIKAIDIKDADNQQPKPDLSKKK